MELWEGSHCVHLLVQTDCRQGKLMFQMLKEVLQKWWQLLENLVVGLSADILSLDHCKPHMERMGYLGFAAPHNQAVGILDIQAEAAQKVVLCELAG